MLIARARQRDRAAFEALYVRHHAAVAAVCRRWLRDEQLAEDAAQETFLRAWMALPHYRPTGDFRSWLRRIARNHCHDLWRAQHGRGVTEVPSDVHTVYLDDAATAASDPAADVAEQLAVRGLLRRLRRRDAMLLVEHHSVGVPVRALAQRWNLTRGAMEVALHRARQRAQRFARDEGLRAVLPLTLCRRLGSWWHQGVQHPGLAMSNVGEALYVGIAVAILVAAPSSTPHPVRDAGGSARVAVAAESVADATPEQLGVVHHRAVQEDDTSRPSRNQRQRARPRKPAADAPTLGDAGSVAIPGVDRTVRSSGSGRTSGRWGVRTPDDKTRAYVSIRGDEAQLLVKVYDTACENTSPDDPLVYCEDE